MSPAAVAPGQSVTVTGSGFAPSQSLSVTFDGAAASPATTTSDASGNFRVTVVVPATATSGSHNITVTGRGSQGSQHQSIGAVSVALASTGMRETLLLGAVALVLIGLGHRLVEHTRWTRAISTASWQRSHSARRTSSSGPGRRPSGS